MGCVVGYVSNRDAAMNGLIKAAMAGLNDTTSDVADKARALVNKDERDLEKSIEALPAQRQGDAIVAEVGSFGIPYASAQEFGPRGKQYLRPAIKSKASLSKIAENIRKHS